MSRPLLAVEQVSKRFGGVRALSEVSLEVRQGEVLSLIGPNGAGKTTLFNVITGFIRPDAGQVFFGQRNISDLPPEAICRRGLVRTFQASRVFGRMSLLGNVMVGAMSWAPSLAEAEEAARGALDFFGARMQQYLYRPAGKLSFANRRRAEIARALATRPTLLALDEPTAGMNPAETQELMQLILSLRGSGLTVFVIEHDMTLVMGISDRIVVLNQGELLTEGRPEAVRNNPKVIEAYLGRPTAPA